MLTCEGFYIWVDNLDEAIRFYEGVFEKKITHREGNRWANFGDVSSYIIGIYNFNSDGEKVVIGGNITPELRTDDINKEYKRIEMLGPQSITSIVVIETPVLYKYFHFTDTWGNTWEVTEHKYTEGDFTGNNSLL